MAPDPQGKKPPLLKDEDEVMLILPKTFTVPETFATVISGRQIVLLIPP